MIRHILDTDTCIGLIRGRSASILKRLRQCPVGSVGISSITLAELQYGVEKSSDPGRNQVALLEFCAPLDILEFGPAAADAYGRVRTILEKKGLPIGPLGTLIAAQTLSLSAILVTCNEREFRRIEGLKVENWNAR